MAGSAWTNQVQFLVIVAGPAGAGVFVYDPSAGTGNLIASLTDAAADPFGNTTVKGVAAYVTFGGDQFAVSLNQAGPGGIPGLTVRDLASLPDTPAGVYAASAASGTADAQLHSGKATAGDVFASVAVASAADSGTSAGAAIITAGVTTVSGQITATGGSAAAPTVISTDTWHNMSLLNSWSLGGGGYAQYKLMPDDTVMLRMANVIPGTVTGGTNVWTVPSGYIPGSVQRAEIIVEASTAAFQSDTPRFDVTTGGQLQVFNVAALMTRVGLQVRYALD